jgi:hypothetical protein
MIRFLDDPDIDEDEKDELSKLQGYK